MTPEEFKLLIELRDSQAKVLAGQGRIEQRLEAGDKRFEEIDHILDGNGKPGLRADVRELQQERAGRRDVNKLWIMVAMAFVSAFAIVATGGVATAIVFMIRMMPGK